MGLELMGEINFESVTLQAVELSNFKISRFNMFLKCLSFEVARDASLTNADAAMSASTVLSPSGKECFSRREIAFSEIFSSGCIKTEKFSFTNSFMAFNSFLLRHP
jgi:hypothetical protein